MSNKPSGRRKAVFTLPDPEEAVVSQGVGAEASRVDIAKKRQMVERKIEQLELPEMHRRLSKGMGLLCTSMSITMLAFNNGWLFEVNTQSPVVLGLGNAILLLMALLFLVSPYRSNRIVVDRESIWFPPFLFLGNGRRLRYQDIRSVEERVTRGEHGSKRLMYVTMKQERHFKISELQLRAIKDSRDSNGFYDLINFLKAQAVLAASRQQQ
ncbi:hypothetical protein [Reinekea blandensis]|uniref:Uncharacterized protein n=1 Tax=Reinekea blandensis MED297 TaxID=314283 RepID=A4BJN0_9GAMM|nr:hypothetical protein [Reinekea blandensis]EAR07670.1 hypothetical protein MED297_06509 [Reinekea sp. MED297] [Reinekea blandensis MED297]